MGASFPDPHYNSDYTNADDTEAKDDSTYKLTLPSYEDLSGKEAFSFIHVFGKGCLLTDLAILKGCKPSDDQYGWYYTKTADENGEIYTVGRHDFSHCSQVSDDRAIRPILHIEDRQEFERITAKRRWTSPRGGCMTVEFGEYPQYAPSNETKNELDMAFRLGGLKKTGRFYTFYNLGFDEKNLYGYYPEIHNEYEFQGKKYIKVGAVLHGKNKNGSKYGKGEHVWLQVLPVEWLVDEQKMTLFSSYGLLSGVCFGGLCRLERYDGNFENTQMNLFLDKYMSKEMFNGCGRKTSKEEPESMVNDDDDRSTEINKIIDDILASVPEYRDRDKVKTKIKETHAKYEEELAAIFERKQSDVIILTNAASVDANDAYVKFKLALDDIKRETMTVSPDEKEYVAMYDFVGRAINVLNSDTGVKDADTIIGDINIVKQNILPVFKEYYDVDIEGELRTILLTYKREIAAFLKNGEDNEIAKIKTFEEFKMLFKSKFVVYLANVIKLVYGNDALEKISSNCINKMQDNFLKNGIRYIDRYLAEINEMVVLIDVYGTVEEKTKMQKILDNEYTLDNNVDEITRLINIRFMKLYGIVLDIKKRQEIEKNKQAFNISVDFSKK